MTPAHAGGASSLGKAAGFQAYASELVADDFARTLASLAPWGGALLAGLCDGSLLVLEPPPAAAASGGGGPGGRGSQAGGAAAAPPWQVVRVQKQFAKRAVTQLLALDVEQRLLSLSDEGVALHSLPDLAPLALPARTAKATAFAWSGTTRQLAVCSRKKVSTYRLEGGSELIEQAEYSVPELVTCLAWVGPNIVAGSKANYWLFVPEPAKQVEVLPGQLMSIHPSVAPQLLSPAGMSGMPCLATLPGEQELLLCKDQTSLFVQPDGKVSRREQLQWGAPPLALVVGPLYAAALLPERLEVQSVSRLLAGQAVKQVLPLPGMTVAARAPAADGSLFVAAPGQGRLRRLAPLPLQQQARLLAAAGDFQAALELCNLDLSGAGSDGGAAPAAAAAGPVDEAARQQLEDQLRLQYAHKLFAEDEPEEALAQLSMCSQADPLVMLRLFPALVPDRFRALLPTASAGEQLPPAPPPDVQPSSEAVTTAMPYLLSHRTRISAQLAQEAAAAKAAEQEGPKGAASKAGKGGDKRAGGAASPGPGAATAAGGAPAPLLTMAAVVDTALMRALLRAPDSGALLRLLQQPNRVYPEVGEADLRAAGRYAELVALLQYAGRHQAGLDLLAQLSRDPAALDPPPSGAATDLKGLPGVWAAVRYLVGVTPSQLELYERAAPWVLAADPQAGLEAALSMRPPLAPQVVMPMLQAHCPDYCPAYLESALDLGVASPAEFHSQLFALYLRQALDEEAAGKQGRPQLHMRQFSLTEASRRSIEAAKLFPEDRAAWGSPVAAAEAVLGGKPLGGARARGAQRKRPLPTGDSSSASSVAGASDSESSEVSMAQAAPPSPPRAAPGHQAGAPPPQESDAYSRLRDLVYTSPHISAQSVLDQLPTGCLPEIRALMLERLGRHRDALSLYVGPLGSLAQAEAYCDRVYAAPLAAKRGAQPKAAAARPARSWVGGGTALGRGRQAEAAAAAATSGAAPEAAPSRYMAPGEEPGDIYMDLLEVVLQPDSEGPAAQRSPAPPTRWRQLCELLSRKRDRIRAQQVLAKLPGDVPQADALPLLAALLQHGTEVGRNQAVVRSLRRSDNLAAREALVRLKQRSCLLTAERACCMCHKRIGTSVVVVHPDGRLAHIMCHKRSSAGAALPQAGDKVAASS